MKQASVLSAESEWSMAGVWNDSFINEKNYAAKARSNLWASELGKPNIELFLKMKGVEPSNPPNFRSFRKFSAGRLIEWIVQVTLARAGVLESTQDWVTHQYPGLLEVTGKLDFIAGGVPDFERWGQWEEIMRKLEIPEDFFKVNQALREHFEKKFPEGLARTILEIKSCSSFAMNSMERTGKGSKNHRMQNYHYLRSKNMELGRVVYVCRDDLRMFEIPLKLSDKKLEAEYRGAIEEITGYYNAHKDTPLDKFIVMEEGKPVAFMPLEGMPPIENNIVWDADYGKFARNWGVEYSNYLTLLYGFTDQKMFEDAVMPQVARWNTALKRVKKGTERMAWLAEHGCMEGDVQKKKVEGKHFWQCFILASRDIVITPDGQTAITIPQGQEVFLPDDIQRGHEINDKIQATLDEIKNEGFIVEELVQQFAGEGEEEEPA